MSGRSITNNIDINKSDLFTLSIRLSTDGFSFSIYNPVADHIFFERKDVDPVISFTANIKRIFKETEYLHASYKQVNVLLISRRYTFIPLDLFDEEQIETFFYYNHNFRENETVCYNILRKNNTVVLFGIDKSSYNFLKDKFESVALYSHFSPLIEFFTTDSRNDTYKKMYSYIRRDSVDIYCFDRGTLLLSNSYECKDENDRQYYILYIWKQLGLDQQADRLHLIGDPPYIDKIQKGLRRFIKEVCIVDYSSKIPFDMDVMLSLNS